MSLKWRQAISGTILGLGLFYLSLYVLQTHPHLKMWKIVAIWLNVPVMFAYGCYHVGRIATLILYPDAPAEPGWE